MNFYSFKDIINAIPEEKNNFNHSYIWWKIGIKYPALILTKIFLRININPNTVTFISIIIGLYGIYLLAIGDEHISKLGIFLIYIWQLLDDVDGNIARTTKTASKYGEFLDDLGAVLIYGFLFFSLGMHVAINPDIYFYKDSLPEILIPYDIFFLSIGSICSMLYVLRLYQNFLFNKVVYRDSTQKNNNDDKRKLILKISYIFNRIRSNIFELMGFLLPFIITSVILKSLDYLLIFYFILFFLDFFIAAFRHLSILK